MSIFDLRIVFKSLINNCRESTGINSRFLLSKELCPWRKQNYDLGIHVQSNHKKKWKTANLEQKRGYNQFRTENRSAWRVKRNSKFEICRVRAVLSNFGPRPGN